MQTMGPVQRGLPLLSTLPSEWKVIAVDIKDCFFSIPLNKTDTKRFAFTVPSYNHEQPDQRYEWVVLPQGMANSPTLCQLFVGKALLPIREKFPQVRCIHYMDDVLLSAKSLVDLENAYEKLIKELESWRLIIAPDKVQMHRVVEYLGARITAHKIFPQKLEIRKDNLKTLNDFQKLLGDINWIRGFLKIANFELKPLYNILQGDSALDSPRELTVEARQALGLVEARLQDASLKRIDENKDFLLCLLPTVLQPTGLLWQDGPLLWVHPKISPAKSIEYYPASMASLGLLGIQQAVQYFGKPPAAIITPYLAHQVRTLCATIDDWAILRCTFTGELDNHYPKHPLMTFFKEHSVVFPKVAHTQPIKGAVNIFTDGSKTGCGVYMIEGKEPIQCQFTPGSPQVVELLIVCKVFKDCPFPFNLISDSAYVVNALKVLEAAGPLRPTSVVSALFQDLQLLICKRTCGFYPLHIRAHTGLPGPLSVGNAKVDLLTRQVWAFTATSIERAV